MVALRQALRSMCLALGGLILAMALAAAASGPASAQGKLDAYYTVSLAGIPIGKGSWTIDIADTHYTATASGVTTGLMHAFIGGEGTSATRGTLLAGRPVSSDYAATIVTRKKTERVRLTIKNGNVKDFNNDPPQDHEAERVPVTEALEQGVLDPMTASLLHAPSSGNPLSPEACQQTLAVFDGRLRYNLHLAFKRIDTVKAEKGYAGHVLVCSVYFLPVAGHIPSRAAIKYISKQHDIEVWLAPIAGTRVLVPFRVQGPTPIGPAVMEATQFVSVATPTRASANGMKTQ